MDAAPAADAPPVVAVVVTCDPGWWLEPCLAALVSQEYPQLAVLVIDAGSAEDPTARIADVAPSAYVRRVRRRRGFAAAANEVLETVEGASYLLVCHDDVVLAPTAARELVDEALRSNAGVVAPKLVEWAAPDRLLAAGMGADGFGVAVPLVERGELDQEQHDAVRDVFFAPSACALVRADLFFTLNGFDVGAGLVGEDLDLGWRAHLAGARVVFAPSAQARHLEATDGGRRALDGSLRDHGPPIEVAASSAAGPHAAVSVDDDWEAPDWGEDEPEASPRRRPGRRRHVDAPSGPALDEDDDAWDDWAAASAGSRRRAGATAVAPAPVAPTTAPRGPEADALDALRTRARLRTLACDYGALRAVVRLSALLAVSLARALVTSVRRGAGPAKRVLQPWRALLHDGRAVRKRRGVVREARVVPDEAVTALQVHGAERLVAAWRDGDGPPAEPGESWLSRRRPGAALAAWAAIAVVVYGTRHLVFGHFPLIGELGAW
ncbi:MAG TPA: glycosyltransferase, partial [Acidimicrobiales bacterium]|nr:glycosyltransferase [Acidimicrobiales bacterium]